MIWAYVVVAAAVLYLALRFRSFQSYIEPVLTITVAIGLVVAIIVWFSDETAPVGSAVDNPRTPTLAAESLVLSDMEAASGQTATSYRVTGTVANNGDLPLQSFRLDALLNDCPAGACREVGRDTALMVIRVLPGESQAFSTFVVFPDGELKPVTAPEWTFGVGEVRASPR